ncbi:MAG: hypothetical protein O3A01_00470 [bacterium]|nr:hypothetical protein [bacterium]
MNKRHLISLFVLAMALFGSTSLVFASESSTHPDGLFFTGAIGGAFNAPTNVQFRQKGEDDVSVFANYSNKSFEDYPYWTMRFENWNANNALEFELIHHKIYLENTPDEVAYFNVSDGYNMFMLNRARRIGPRIWRVGGGVVIGHAESKVRGQKLDSSEGLGDAGFFVGGPAVQAGVEWRRFTTETLFFSLEQKLTAAYTEFPINDGVVSGFNFAWHINLRWGSKKPGTGASLKDHVVFWSPLAMPFTLDAVFPRYIDKQ